MTQFGSALELRNVSVAYDGNTLALQGLNLEVRSGELLSLLGRNGSGKSTTLRTLGGLVEPQSGQILVDGVVASAQHRRKATALMYGDYGLHGEMTVVENVAHALRGRGLDRAEMHRRCRTMLERLHLEQLARQEVFRLSAGEKQRLSLARVLAQGASAVLLHEPLSQVDDSLRAELRDNLRELQRSTGVTVVMVPRDRVTALAISDRIAVLREGQVVQAGTPRDLYTDPPCGYVAEAVGDVNRLVGRVKARDAGASRALVSTALGDIWSSCGAQTGDEVEVLIRPEALTTSGTAEGHRFTGRLETVLFRGSHYQLHISVAGIRLRAMVPPSPGLPLSPGETISLYVDSEACRCVPEAPSRSHSVV